MSIDRKVILSQLLSLPYIGIGFVSGEEEGALEIEEKNLLLLRRILNEVGPTAVYLDFAPGHKPTLEYFFPVRSKYETVEMVQEAQEGFIDFGKSLRAWNEVNGYLDCPCLYS